MSFHMGCSSGVSMTGLKLVVQLSFYREAIVARPDPGANMSYVGRILKPESASICQGVAQQCDLMVQATAALLVVRKFCIHITEHRALVLHFHLISSVAMVSGKDRLYVALYIRGGKPKMPAKEDR
jgi:hypothetical protein